MGSWNFVQNYDYLSNHITISTRAYCSSIKELYHMLYNLPNSRNIDLHTTCHENVFKANRSNL